MPELGSCIGKASIGKASIGKASIGKASIGKASIGKASIGKALIVRAPHGRFGAISKGILREMPRPIVVTLGNFDGVHRGHQSLIQRVKKLGPDSGGTGVVVTFYPHPAVVLGRARDVDLPSITTLRQKLTALHSYGISLVCAIHFTPRFSQLSAAEFLQLVMIDGLDVDQLILGPDARIGKGGAGDTKFIAEWLVQHQRSVEVIEPFELHGERISSRKIRSLIAKGDVAHASEQIGRPFRLVGKVVHGEQRGTSIGFSTANLQMNDQIVPARGVYCGVATVNGQEYQAVVNIGQRPTFNRDRSETELRDAVEVHLLDFGAQIYGAHLELDFVERLRDEQRFSGVDALRQQITKDVDLARKILSNRLKDV